MKVLVTGGAGFIGTNLIKKLISEGHDVHSLDNYDSGTIDNHVDGCNYHTGDIENIGLMDRDFDKVFHLRHCLEYNHHLIILTKLIELILQGLKKCVSLLDTLTQN